MSKWTVFEERGARWANIVAALPGFYCGYAVWDQRHSGGATPVVDTRLTIALIGFFACIAIGAVLNFLRTDKRSSKPVSGDLGGSANIERSSTWLAEMSELKQQHESQLKRLENDHSSELSRALAIRDQLKAEKRQAFEEISALREKLAFLSPHQAKALSLIRGLVNLRDQAGAIPDELSKVSADESAKRIFDRLNEHLQALHGWQSATDADFRLHHARDLETFRLQVSAENPERTQQASVDLWTLETVANKRIETPEDINQIVMALWRLLSYLEDLNGEDRLPQKAGGQPI